MRYWTALHLYFFERLCDRQEGNFSKIQSWKGPETKALRCTGGLMPFMSKPCLLTSWKKVDVTQFGRKKGIAAVSFIFILFISFIIFLRAPCLKCSSLLDKSNVWARQAILSSQRNVKADYSLFYMEATRSFTDLINFGVLNCDLASVSQKG